MELYELKNYWVFYRNVKGKRLSVIGEPMLPYRIDAERDKLNEQLLERLLNEGDVFDVNLQPKRGDRLELGFSSTFSNHNGLHYGFEYKNKKWVPKEFDFLMWRWNHDQENFGKIKNGLVNEPDEH